MARQLDGRRVAFLATDGVEEVEYTEPRRAVEQAGAEVDLVSIKAGQIQAVQHGDKTGTYPVDRTIDQANPDDYEALVLPGGVANPDKLRMDRARWPSSRRSSRPASRSGRSATGRGCWSRRTWYAGGRSARGPA